MERIDPARLAEKFIELIGREWMSRDGGQPGKVQYDDRVVGRSRLFVEQARRVRFLVRPERYTYEFMERETCFTLYLFGTWRQGDLSYLRLEIGSSDR